MFTNISRYAHDLQIYVCMPMQIHIHKQYIIFILDAYAWILNFRSVNNVNHLGLLSQYQF